MTAGRIKALLTEGKSVFLVPVFLVVALVGAGVLIGAIGTPSVAGVDNEFGAVTNDTTGIRTALVVDNPNPFGIRLGNTSVNYTVRMNDVPMASGNRSDLALSRGDTTLVFSTRMENGRIPAWWVTHVRNGERSTVEIDSTVRSSLVGRSVTVPHRQEIETDIIGGFNSTERRPVNASAPFVSDPVLYVEETGANWGTVTDEETPIRMRMRVYNPKRVPYTVTEIGYDVTMNDVHVGNGTTERPYVIPGESSETIRMRTVIRNDRLDEWWVTHLRNDQTTDLEIAFHAKVELPSGRTVRVPLSELTYEKEIGTDIFRNDSAEGALEAANGSSGTTRTADGATPSTSTDDGPSAPADGSTTGTTAETTETHASTTETTTTDIGTTTDDGGLLGSLPTFVTADRVLPVA